MALVLADRVKDTTTTTGTGTVTLSGTAPSGFQNFSVVGNGNTTYYTLVSGSAWEVGIGTYSSTGPTLSRDTVLSSSASGSKITLSGTSDVFVTLPSERVGVLYTPVKTSNYNANVQDGVQTNTTGGAFTVTLPASPAAGDQVVVVDSAGTWATNNLTVGRNGSTIEGLAEDLVCNISGVSVQLIYSGTTWDVYAQVGGAGAGVISVPGGGTGVSTFSAGYLLKGNGTSPVSASVVYDSGTNVGIGTSSPGGKLQVAAGALGQLIVAYNGTSVNYTDVDTNIFRSAAGSERMRITSAGNVGVGTSTPSTKLDVNGTVNFSGAMTSGDLADAVGYKSLPQNAQTSSYTLALSDMGKHISITTGGVVIPANASVTFPIGSAVAIYNNSGSNQTISITSDTLRQAGTSNTGSRTLAQYGLCTVTKVASTTWVISGAGVS